VRGNLTKGGEPGGHVGESLRSWLSVIQRKSEQMGS
jgi:hypothetical protein